MLLGVPPLPVACRPKKNKSEGNAEEMLLANEMRRNRGKSRSNLQNGEVSGAASAELLRRRFPTSFVTTHGACRPRTPTSLALPVSGTLPSSSARRSCLRLCSTSCASSVGVLLTALHHRLLDALRATLWPASPPRVAAFPRARRSRPSPQWALCACASPARGAPAAAASACERPGPRLVFATRRSSARRALCSAAPRSPPSPRPVLAAIFLCRKHHWPLPVSAAASPLQ